MAQNSVIPVTCKRHGQRYWKRFTSFEFAATRTECAVVFREIRQVAAAFPVYFRKSEIGVEPRALLSLSSSIPTPFVSQDGRWLASYIPSALRSYPFQAGYLVKKSKAQNPRFQLLVDEASGLVTDDDRDEAFFDSSGIISTELARVRTFLESCAAAGTETLEICNTIDEMGLFVPAQNLRRLESPRELLEISPSRLADLSAAERMKLLATGGIMLIHAHQISMSHCDWLERAQERREKYTKNSDISDFLCAVINAQNADFSGRSGV